MVCGLWLLVIDYWLLEIIKLTSYFLFLTSHFKLLKMGNWFMVISPFKLPLHLLLGAGQAKVI